MHDGSLVRDTAEDVDRDGDKRAVFNVSAPLRSQQAI